MSSSSVNPNANPAPATPGTLEDFARQANFLAIDDDLTHLRQIELALEKWGYNNVYSTTDATEFLKLFEEIEPDIILIDLMLANANGLDVLRKLQNSLPPGEYIPVVAVSDDAAPDMRRKALAMGARDYFVKPLDMNEMMLRLLNLLETRYLHIQLKDQNQMLEATVEARTAALRASQMEVLQRLGQAAEYRDDETGLHTQRVGELSAAIAAALGLPADQVELIRRAAPLHDVGKIGIADGLLTKPNALTPEEFEQMKTHTTIGAHLVGGGESPFLRTAESIARSHHERWNGAGYPQGLKGEEIPIDARIVSVADVFDILSHDRPYRKAWAREEALAEIRKQAGEQFDPAVVEAFFKVQEGG